MDMGVLYLCDRRACAECSPECKHTTDITHAKNFELHSEKRCYVETGKTLAIFHMDCRVEKKKMEEIRNNIKKYMEDGFILCDASIKPMVVDDDRCIVWKAQWGHKT